MPSSWAAHCAVYSYFCATFYPPPVGVQYNSIMQPEGIMDPWGGPSYLWKECNNIPFLLESTSYLRNLRDSIERPGTFQWILRDHLRGFILWLSSCGNVVLAFGLGVVQFGASHFILHWDELKMPEGGLEGGLLSWHLIGDLSSEAQGLVFFVAHAAYHGADSPWHIPFTFTQDNATGNFVASITLSRQQSLRGGIRTKEEEPWITIIFG